MHLRTHLKSDALWFHNEALHCYHFHAFLLIRLISVHEKSRWKCPLIVSEEVEWDLNGILKGLLRSNAV